MTALRLPGERRRLWCGALAAFGLTAAVWTAALALFGVYPFGDASILITDLDQQYVEFHAALYDMVRDGDSLLFTWNTGMGMNFLGLFAYYLSSPFTVLLLLFPRAMLTEAVLCIISVKIAASALTFSLYLRGRHGVGGAVNLLSSLCYALGAYSVTYCFNLMWLDGVVLLPLVVWAARRVFETRRPAALTAALTVLFIANFYIAYVAGIFTFLLFVAWLLAQPGDRRLTLRRLGAFFGATGLAAGLAAFLLLPTLFALLGSYESVHGLTLTFWAGANPLALPGKLGWAAFDSATNSGTPTLYCGVLAIGLVPLWFTHRDIPRREKLAVGGVLLFMLASLLLYDLDLAWHVFQPPNWFPYRYTFVILFLLVTCTARVLARPRGIRPLAEVLSFAAEAGITVLAGAAEGIPYAGCWQGTLLLLAVYGGLFLGVRAASVRAPYPQAPLHFTKRGAVKTALVLLLTLCVTAEVLGNTAAILEGLDGQFGFVERQNFADYLERNSHLTALLDEQEDDGFYRVENSTARNANDGMDAGYHAMSHYSSLSNQKAFHFMGQLGMISYVQNRFFRYMGSTSALDAVMGVKYVWDTEERRPYMRATGASYGDTTLFRNEMALPLVYFADSALDADQVTDGRPFEAQNALFSSLNGRDTAYYSPLDVTVRCENGLAEPEGDRVSVPAGSQLYFTIDNPRRQHVLLYFENSLHENSSVYLDDELLNVYDDRLVRGVIDLGVQEAGAVEVRIPVWYAGWYGPVQAASFDEEAFAALIAELRDTSPSSLAVTDRTVEGTLTAPRDGVIFTSIPYDAGWTATVDGQQVEPLLVGGALMALPVSQGEHTFSLHFTPRGLTAGLCISGGALLLCGILLILRYRTRRNRRPVKGSAAK